MNEEKCDICNWIKKYGISWLKIHGWKLNDVELAKHLDVNVEQISIIKKRYLERKSQRR